MSSAHELKPLIESAFERRAELTSAEIEGSTRPAVESVMAALEAGVLRVAEPVAPGQWQVNQWLKKAVLLYFRVNDMRVLPVSTRPSFASWVPAWCPVRWSGAVPIWDAMSC